MLASKEKADLAVDAEYLAGVLIKLQKEYPFFFKDVDPDDPDLNLNRAFKTFFKRKKQWIRK